MKSIEFSSKNSPTAAQSGGADRAFYGDALEWEGFVENPRGAAPRPGVRRRRANELRPEEVRNGLRDTGHCS